MPKLDTDPPVASLIFVLKRTPEAMVVRAIGEVDLATIPMLWSNLKTLLEDHLNVVVDLTGIEYIDSAGMHALLDAHRLFTQCGQQLALAEPSRIFRMLLREIVGFERPIPLFVSVAAALVSFRSPAVLSPAPRYEPAQAARDLTAV